MVLLSRTSELTGERNFMRINISEQSFFLKFPRLYSKTKPERIQDVFPELTDDEREFIKTGITPEEWETLKNECEESAIPYDQG